MACTGGDGDVPLTAHRFFFPLTDTREGGLTHVGRTENQYLCHKSVFLSPSYQSVLAFFRV